MTNNQMKCVGEDLSLSFFGIWSLVIGFVSFIVSVAYNMLRIFTEIV